MNKSTEALQDAIGCIGDDLIMNALRLKKKKPAFRSSAAVAACTALVVAAAAVSSVFLGNFVLKLPPETTAATNTPPMDSDIFGLWQSGDGTGSTLVLESDHTFVYYRIVTSEKTGEEETLELRGSFEAKNGGITLYAEGKTYSFELSADLKALTPKDGNEMGGFFIADDTSLSEESAFECLGGLWVCGDINAGEMDDTMYYFAGNGSCNVISFAGLAQSAHTMSFDGENVYINGRTEEAAYSGGRLTVKRGGKTLEYHRAALGESLRLSVSSGESALVCPNMYLEALIWSEEERLLFPLPGKDVFEKLEPVALGENVRFTVAQKGALSYTLYSNKGRLLYEAREAFEKPAESGIYFLDVCFSSGQNDAISSGRILHYYITIEIK